MIGKLWFALAVVVSVSAAHMYRYEQVPNPNIRGETLVWDRWTQRVCSIGFRTDNELVCSRARLKELMEGG